MTAILVLYEDSRSGSGSFGPHDLLAALVADQTGKSVWEVKQSARERPLRGIDKLLKALSDPGRLSNLVPGGVPILAVVDGDRIREHMGLKRNAPARQVEQELKESCNEPDRITVVLLERNVESLVEAARDCDENFMPDRIADALMKDINARDLVLQAVAFDAGRRDLRDCIRKRVPSLERAIATIAEAVAA